MGNTGNMIEARPRRRKSGRSRMAALSGAVIVAAASLCPRGARATDSTWALDANGNWSVGPNWIPAASPNGIGDAAHFLGVITAPRTITQNVSGLTLGRI